jgi:hypothetical protein
LFCRAAKDFAIGEQKQRKSPVFLRPRSEKFAVGAQKQFKFIVFVKDFGIGEQT